MHFNQQAREEAKPTEDALRERCAALEKDLATAREASLTEMRRLYETHAPPNSSSPSGKQKGDQQHKGKGGKDGGKGGMGGQGGKGPGGGGYQQNKGGKKGKGGGRKGGAGKGRGKNYNAWQQW